MPAKTTKNPGPTAKAPATRKARKTAPPLPPAAPAREAPTGKLGALVRLLSRTEGATIEDLIEASGWQAHSVRGAISGSLKKKLGYAVSSTKTERGRIYRIEPAQAGPVEGAGA